jgi:hypothetical protein
MLALNSLRFVLLCLIATITIVLVAYAWQCRRTPGATALTIFLSFGLLVIQAIRTRFDCRNQSTLPLIETPILMLANFPGSFAVVEPKGRTWLF